MNINFFLHKLQTKIGANSPIQKISIVPAENATIDNCFINVLDRVSQQGGAIVYGWDLMLTDLLFEAQRHAVWQSPDEKLLDITPRVYKSDSSIFIADNRWYYNGEVTDNVRINVTDNSVVDDFILVAETIIKLYQTGKRNEDGKLILVNKILIAIQILERMKNDLNLFLVNGGNTDSICFCCGKKIYSNCFGVTVKSEMELILHTSSVLLQQFNSVKDGST